jgi:hypothetical protein
VIVDIIFKMTIVSLSLFVTMRREIDTWFAGGDPSEGGRLVTITTTDFLLLLASPHLVLEEERTANSAIIGNKHK